MKIIGVLGGMSSVASGEYYRLLNEGVNAHLGGHASAEILLYSVDFAVIEDCIRNERWDEAAEYLIDRAQRLERAGAEFLILATNTLHRVAAELEAAVDIPFVHIVDPTADAASEDGATTLGLLGTAPVMEAEFYRDRFADHGLRVLVPDQQDRALVHRVIFEELTRGIVDDRSRQEYLRVMRELIAQGADGIVLGCTEISLLVAPEDLPDAVLYDTTALHVDRAVDLALGLRPLRPVDDGSRVRVSDAPSSSVPAGCSGRE
jgi:aspartate racemase